MRRRPQGSPSSSAAAVPDSEVTGVSEFQISWVRTRTRSVCAAISIASRVPRTGSTVIARTRAPFLAAGLLALGIAVGTIEAHAWRVARTNPIGAPRYE